MIENLSPAAARRRLSGIGALVGGAITFMVVGILDELAKIGVGALIGAAVGVVVWAQLMRRRRAGRVVDLSEQTKADLDAQARRLGVEGRSAMTKEELAEAIAARQQHREVGSTTNELLVETMDAVASKVDDAVTRLGDKLRQSTNEKSSTPDS